MLLAVILVLHLRGPVFVETSTSVFLPIRRILNRLLAYSHASLDIDSVNTIADSCTLNGFANEVHFRKILTVPYFRFQEKLRI